MLACHCVTPRKIWGWWHSDRKWHETDHVMRYHKRSIWENRSLHSRFDVCYCLVIYEVQFNKYKKNGNYKFARYKRGLLLPLWGSWIFEISEFLLSEIKGCCLISRTWLSGNILRLFTKSQLFVLLSTSKSELKSVSHYNYSSVTNHRLSDSCL